MVIPAAGRPVHHSQGDHDARQEKDKHRVLHELHVAWMEGGLNVAAVVSVIVVGVQDFATRARTCKSGE